MKRLRIVVLGYMVRGPLGGLAWHHLQYVLGLVALGHDAWFVEDSDDYPGCYDPSTGQVDVDPTYGLRFIEAVFRRAGLADRWAYHDAHRSRWHGPAAGRFAAGREGADVLLNVSGVNPLRDWMQHVPCRVLIDTDPAFTQIRHLDDPAAMARARNHTHFLSFGENVGQPGCAIPDDSLPWRATRQPIVLEQWPVASPAPHGPLTTVMQWDSYAPRHHAGRVYGMKSASFQPYADLPTRSGRPFLVAMGSATAPREALAAHRWSLVDPLAVTRDPWSYQDFIAASRAEFSVAKAGYVDSRSGWFSERSAAYLASGKPVIVQDSAFTRWLRVPAGVLPFSSPEEALDQLARLDREYDAQCAAARRVAQDYFDAGAVLSRLLDDVLA
ncbi:hypothetical protein TBR22_A06560 [Luteitalea sp. TBR-22]|uniref:hypothetical protein n=1 Tax=Luteitalea sp. TBR-22 TaxID=2802971 RepID=UPI001AF31A1C|nr:hypothetical protein [Luteitalea sp. TBR-22]BCS31455.1 hypothetical protein TBR22_A06560 [Luteitalea sp. TBR-22]